LTAEGRTLITGAAGFGGSGLARALLARGYGVTGLDVTPPAHARLLRRELSHPNFRYLWKSIQDIQPGDVAGHSVVAHLAAQPDTPLAFESPRYTVMQNVAGTVEVLEAVRRAGGVSKVIFAGSGNEVGRPDYIPMDEDHPLTPHNPYGFSKAAGELAMWAWYRAYGVPAVILSTGVVVGPGMRREVFIFKWLWNALHGHPIVVEGGQQTRDLTFIDDVVAAWTLAIEALEDLVVGEKFYVGYGEEHTVEELARMCQEAAGAPVSIEYTDYRPGEEGQREAFSNRKARTVLGYVPRVSPAEAIALTAGWMRGLGESLPGEVNPPP
jgi:nucleoside-diphosphate-sugar epimerase